MEFGKQERAANRASQPLVSVGLPVKNGKAGLRRALDNLLMQPYQNIEIIISDNASEDETWRICVEAAQTDARVHYVRQETPISGVDNFNYVLDAARGKYFLWAAYDDYRSDDFIITLVAHLEQTPRAVLAYGDTVLCYPNGEIISCKFDFATTGKGAIARLWKTSQIQYFHVYGMWRREMLDGIRFRNCPFWADMPLMLAAAARGVFARVEGPVFFRGERIKSNEEILQYFFGISAQKTGRVRLLTQLLEAAYVSAKSVGGGRIGALSIVFILIRFVRQSLSFRQRWSRRKLALQGRG